MTPGLKAAWRGLRSRFWWSLAFDVALILVLFLAIHVWQTRDLPGAGPAPHTVLERLDGSGLSQAIQPGTAGVIYFFAPWCFYCRNSIGNLDELVSGGWVPWGTAVALDFRDAREVEEFVGRTGISLPVLMGDSGTAEQWSVRAFPTYYVIDAEGRISSRSVGYSTTVGLLARAWLAD
jgi:hypothetical protein